MDTCPICRTKFRRHYRRGGVRQVYCSKACKYKSEYVKRKCPTCGRHFQTNLLSNRKKYCSLACIQRHPCLFCGKIITGRVRFQSGERRFCDRRCASIANRTLSGKRNYIVIGFAARLRKAKKISCEVCGIDDIRVLVVHHKNRDRRDIRVRNLRVLCANHHHIIHWGKGRGARRTVRLAKLIAASKWRLV
jgi:hypothetical protein